MTTGLPHPLEDTAPLADRRLGDLWSTGKALVTIRNEAGDTLVFRFQKRDPWTRPNGQRVPGEGFWLECRQGTAWTPCGIVHDAGYLQPTLNATSDDAIQFAARLMLDALIAGKRVTESNGRLYTLFVN